jgi:hypothetical protein
MTTSSILQRLTKDELYEMAKERDLPGRSGMDKDELVRDKIDGNEIALSPEEPEPTQVTNLLGALRASVEATKQQKKSA